MNNLLKNTAKFAVGTCLTLGAVAVAASVVAGSNLGKIVFADEEKPLTEQVETSSDDFEE